MPKTDAAVKPACREGTKIAAVWVAAYSRRTPNARHIVICGVADCQKSLPKQFLLNDKRIMRVHALPVGSAAAAFAFA